MKESVSQPSGQSGKMAQHIVLAEHLVWLREMGRDIFKREVVVLNSGRGGEAMQTEIRNQEKDSRKTFTADFKK